MTATAAKPQTRQSSLAASRHRKGVTTMIKRITKALFSRRRPDRDRRPFNEQLLERHREDVYLLMHQQMRGMN